MVKRNKYRIDIVALLNSWGIPHWVSGKNVRPGNVNIRCPMCDDGSNHGGFGLYRFNYRCWRCSAKDPVEVLSNLLSLSTKETWQEIVKHKTGIISQSSYFQYIEKKTKLADKLKWPIGMVDLQKQHKAYLENRNFDPQFAVRKMGVKGTLGYGDWSNRIIFPIYKNKQPIAYQGRTISKDPNALRYKFLKAHQEIYPSKNLMYGIDKLRGKTALVVEGLFEYMRFRPYGRNVVATMGTSLKESQIASLVQADVERCFILFDWREKYTCVKAQYLAEELSVLGIESEWLELSETEAEDPAELSEVDAKYVMNWVK